jgi:hypothetical protein
MSTPPPVYTALDLDEVAGYLGTYYPVPEDVTVLVLPPDAPEQFTGAVAVYPRPGRPGQTWWAVDGEIPPQAAGTPDDALMALLPGSSLYTPQPPADDPTPPHS